MNMQFWQKFSRFTLGGWMFLTSFATVAVVISLIGLAQPLGIVQVGWWKPSSGIMNREFWATAVFALIGTLALFQSQPNRSRLASVSAGLFVLSGYAMTAAAPEPATATDAVFELGVLHLPLACSVLWLLLLRPEPTKGDCKSCGYSLKGIRGDRCPECGADFSRA